MSYVGASGLGASPPVPVTGPEVMAQLSATAELYYTPQMAAATADVRRAVAKDFVLDLPQGTPMVGNEVTAWADEWFSKHGLPRDTDEMAGMMEAFVTSNATKIGVPAEMVAGYDLIKNMPTTLDEGAAWSLELGKTFAESYGIPLSTKGVALAAARIACTYVGVSPGLVDVVDSVFGDGKLTAEDAENLAVAAACVAGAAIAQAFGIPAPLGALAASLITDGFVGMFKNIFGPSESEKQRAAWRKAERARQARMAECMSAGLDAWASYNEYWDTVIGNLSAMLDSAEMGWLIRASGGVRHFGVTYDPNAMYYSHFCLLTDGTYNPNGCLYLCRSGQAEGCDWTGALTMQIRHRYDLLDNPVKNMLETVDIGPGGTLRAGTGTIDPRALLFYWWTERLKTFPATTYSWEKTDRQNLETASYVGEVWVEGSGGAHPTSDCAIGDSIKRLQDNMMQLEKFSGLVSRDIIATASWAAGATAALDLLEASLASNQHARFRECYDPSGQTIAARYLCIAAGARLNPMVQLHAVPDPYSDDMTDAERELYRACQRQRGYRRGGPYEGVLPPPTVGADCRIEVLGVERSVEGLVGAAKARAEARIQARKLRQVMKKAAVGAAVVGGGYLLFRGLSK